jgi:hypothetical protein
MQEAKKKVFNFSFRGTILFTAVGLAGGGFSPMAFGSLIGELNLGGSILVSSASGGSISFVPLSSGSPFTFQTQVSTGSFAVISAGTDGTETTSLTPALEPLNTVLSSPITGFLDIPTTPSGALTFDLTEVLGPATTGVPLCTTTTTSGSCYILGAPYNFNTGSGGSSATFAVVGNLHYNGQTASNVVLEYSATFVNESIGAVLTAFQTTGSSMQSSDGEVSISVSATPEPGTLPLLMAGICLIGVGVSFKKRNLSRVRR